MKLQLASYVLAALLFSVPAFAQVTSKDSLQALNDQKKAIDLSKEVNEKKIKLVDKQKNLEKKRADLQENTQKAQASADANTAAARDLATNPQDKKLSKKASNAAKDAQRDAKNARKASDDIEKLNKDIAELQKDIQEKEQELASTGGSSASGMVRPALSGSSASQGSTQQSAYPSNQQPAYRSDSSMMQGNSAAQTNPNAPYVVQRNITPDANGADAAAIAQRVLEATYRSYPQQQGQPAIIINNIIVPSDYNARQPQGAKPAGDGIAAEDRSDYEDYKNWLKYRRGEQAGRSDGARNRRSFDKKGDRDLNRNEDRDADKDKDRDFDKDQDRASEQDETRDDESEDKESRLGFKERFGEKKARNSGMWVIPMAGIHASSFNADFQDDQYAGRAGWNAGLDFRFRIRKFFIQPGVHYFSSSMDVTSEDSISTAPLLTGPRIHSLKAPLMLGIYLTKAKGGFLRFNIKGGVVGSYVLNVDQNDSQRFDKDNIEEFSYGLNAGFGLELGFITFDFSHEWGMSRFFKESNQKNNILRATVGFKL
ncbi:porin family protein [Dyadobacter sp. CY326]|uniref:porin family protein n=1 Tax=Dyadobacter sp. CY326 TaxID=2907300 RepID=UPI001F1CD0D6|nr:porin family protein [Dyadobacter sp. CY326]MCE7067018.1 outer membrane beta-barrel protein [Dyadobacter sp. CY326]